MDTVKSLYETTELPIAKIAKECSLPFHHVYNYYIRLIDSCQH